MSSSFPTFPEFRPISRETVCRRNRERVQRSFIYITRRQQTGYSLIISKRMSQFKHSLMYVSPSLFYILTEC